MKVDMALNKETETETDLIQIIYMNLYGFKCSDLIIICLHTVICFQVFLCNTNNLHEFIWF